MPPSLGGARVFPGWPVVRCFQFACSCSDFVFVGFEKNVKCFLLLTGIEIENSVPACSFTCKSFGFPK